MKAMGKRCDRKTALHEATTSSELPVGVASQKNDKAAHMFSIFWAARLGNRIYKTRQARDRDHLPANHVHGCC
jgi:hypothetical protein